MITKDVIDKEKITEGDRVLFTGLFYRLPRDHKMKPIIREGTLAMLPDEKIKTTGGKLGTIYLADVDAIKGSSGSPVMVNLGGMRQGSIMGDRELLLGIVSGYFVEDENLNLEVTTTIHGSGQANSGISIIVPADELKKLLEQPEVQQLRDAEGEGQNWEIRGYLGHLARSVTGAYSFAPRRIYGPGHGGTRAGTNKETVRIRTCRREGSYR